MTHDEKIVEAVARAILHEQYGGEPEDVPNLYQKALWTARVAITAYQAEAWQGDLDAMPYGEEFLAENRFGDWLTVRRFDPRKPGDYSANAVINGRTGRWWHPTRWQPVLLTPAPKATP